MLRHGKKPKLVPSPQITCKKKACVKNPVLTGTHIIKPTAHSPKKFFLSFSLSQSPQNPNGNQVKSSCLLCSLASYQITYLLNRVKKPHNNPHVYPSTLDFQPNSTNLSFCFVATSILLLSKQAT